MGLIGHVSDALISLEKTTLLFSGLMLLVIFCVKRSRLLSFSFACILIFLARYLNSLSEIYSDLGSDSFREAGNFDLKEAFFYIKTLTPHVYAFIDWTLLGRSAGVALSVLVIGWVLGKTVAHTRYRDAFVLLSALALIYAGLSAGVRSAMAQFHEASAIHDSIERNFTFPGNIHATNSGDHPLTIFVYVGESTSAMNMQLYGYPRRTTPKLVDLSNSDAGMVVFDKVFSTHTHTSPSLSEAFSMRPMSQTNQVPIDTQRRVSLIDALGSWGVRVALYSNQGRTGSYNLTSSIVFRAAERYFSIDEPIGNVELKTRPLDSDYLPKVITDTAFTDDSTSVVVFHSYAGHGDYLDYVPPNFHMPEWLTASPPEHERRENSIDHYDTAISYVDANVTSAVNYVASLKKPTIFIYFSDHGESPSMDDGHDSSRFRVEMAHIPFIVYFNETARRDFPERFAEMKKLSATRNVSTLAQLVPTILSLMGYEIDSSAGLDIPPPVGSEWSPFPILVRSTAEGISYLRFTEASDGKSVDGRTTCFAPTIPLPDSLPAARNSECVTLETVRP